METRMEVMEVGVRRRRGGWDDNGPLFEPLEDRLLLSLLGVGAELVAPPLVSSLGGTTAYTAAADDFVVDSAPLFILFPGGPAFVAGGDIDIDLVVDGTGSVSADLVGDEIIVQGTVTDPTSSTTYTGVLLTGNIVAFGFADSGGTTDQFDFRFTPTGGQLFGPYFVGKDIGALLTVENSTFTDNFEVNFGGSPSKMLLGEIQPLPPPPASALGDRVWEDVNGNGIQDDGEPDVVGVTVTLTGGGLDGVIGTGGDDTTAVQVTGTSGGYLFTNLNPGEQYQVTFSDLPSGFVFTQQDAGTDDALDSDANVATGTTQIVTLVPGETNRTLDAGIQAALASIDGFVWVDANDNGEIEQNESAIEGVTVTLLDQNGDVVATDITDADGYYAFTDLQPGTYTIRETQPAAYADGQDALGTVDGVPTGTVGADEFTVTLNAGDQGFNYNFGEVGDGVAAGQTATIGYWRNKNGQKLLKAVNGGLADWLATTFPNMYGHLAGMSNADVAAYYKNQVFQMKLEGAGPTKFDAQVMAVAFASYVTNSTLAGTAGGSYGFHVTTDGVGIATWDVGDNYEAFGLTAGDTVRTVMFLLLYTDSQTSDVTFDGVGDLYQLDAYLRSMANEVYTAINEYGDIG